MVVTAGQGLVHIQMLAAAAEVVVAGLAAAVVAVEMIMEGVHVNPLAAAVALPIPIQALLPV
jgi:N-acetylglucosamine-6-phosphate deacetylase